MAAGGLNASLATDKIAIALELPDATVKAARDAGLLTPQRFDRLLIEALRRRDYESLSLTVTSVNTRAVGLYERLGFRTIKTFAAGVWTA